LAAGEREAPIVVDIATVHEWLGDLVSTSSQPIAPACRRGDRTGRDRRRW